MKRTDEEVERLNARARELANAPSGAGVRPIGKHPALGAPYGYGAALNEKQIAFLPTVPERARILVGRALAGTVSPRQCIKAKCLDCSQYDRAEAAACTVVLCPLWAVNPYRLKSADTDED